jgi:hypothetical protein
MTAYRETFRKHRVLFCLPPLLGLIAAAVFAFGTPKKYQSSASLWVDNGPLAGSSLSSTSDPATSEQTLLNELLATRRFDLAVGQGSSLSRYISAQGGSREQIAGNLATAVASGAASSTAGPQVLVLTFTGPSPSVAQSALQSLVAQLQSTVSHYGQTYGQTAQAYYQAQVKMATQALSRDTAAASAYKTAHPRATSANSQNYAALQAAEQTASSQLQSATSALSQATGEAAGGNGTSFLVRVVDPPVIPTAPTSGKKKMLLVVVAGLLAGLLLSLSIIAVMTPSRDDRWDAEVTGDDEFAGSQQARGGGKTFVRDPVEIDHQPAIVETLAPQDPEVDQQPAIAETLASPTPAVVTTADTQRRQFAVHGLSLGRRPAS